MPTLTVLWWRDIPAQVIARGRAKTEKVVLPGRFQVAIDRAADIAGRTGNDEYLADWRRVSRACGDDVAGEVAREAAALDNRYTRDVLQRLVDAGGIDVGSDAGSATAVGER